MVFLEPPVDDPRRFDAALLVAARLWERRKSPVGVTGGFEGAAVYVGRTDPDVRTLLIGLRRYGFALDGQTWPTVDDLRNQTGAAPSVDDAELQQKLDSAVATVTAMCRGAGISGPRVAP